MNDPAVQKVLDDDATVSAEMGDPTISPDQIMSDQDKADEEYMSLTDDQEDQVDQAESGGDEDDDDDLDELLEELED